MEDILLVRQINKDPQMEQLILAAAAAVLEIQMLMVYLIMPDQLDLAALEY